MRIGCPKEVKPQEFRVGLTAPAARELVNSGHGVMVETGAGEEAGFPDAYYLSAGATIADSAAEVFANAELIVKVKEPQPAERKLLRPGQILFTYLHLAADATQTEELLDSGCTAIAYETVTDEHGGLPLLAPMSEVAGCLAPQVGAWALQRANGGRGVLLGGVPGVPPARVTVIGGGMVGTHAARIAAGMGAEVIVLDRSLQRLHHLDETYNTLFRTQYSTADAIEYLISKSAMVIGAVLLPGAAAPKLVRRSNLPSMRRGAVLVDVAIDQGGCFETSHPTTHEDPIYEVDGIMHYCVTNMPGAVPRTSTIALGNATLPFVFQIANRGWRDASLRNPHLAAGVNLHEGKLYQQAVGTALDMPVVDLHDIVA